MRTVYAPKYILLKFISKSSQTQKSKILSEVVDKICSYIAKLLTDKFGGKPGLVVGSDGKQTIYISCDNGKNGFDSEGVALETSTQLKIEAISYDNGKSYRLENLSFMDAG